MSTAEVEAVKPEQPATSSTQDETMNTEEEARATENAEVEAVEVGEGATETKPAKAESKAELTNKLSGGKREKNGIRTDEDGVLKTSAKEDLENIKNNSKYDPSVLPESDDPHLIRQQVCLPVLTRSLCAVNVFGKKRSNFILATATYPLINICGI
jgi:lupus La protein